MISLCLATKNRPNAFKNMWKSALKMADNPDEIEVCSYHDSKDDLYEFPPNHKEAYGDNSRTILYMMNEAQKVATGDLFMFIADDFMFDTPHWDTLIKAEFDKVEDKILLVCPGGDWWEKWGYGVLGIVHRRWVDTVGYFIPPFWGAESADRWVNELATSVNRRVRLDSVHCTHINVRDKVHRENHNRNKGWRSRYKSEDMVKRREMDINKLRKVICESKHCVSCTR